MSIVSLPRVIITAVGTCDIITLSSLPILARTLSPMCQLAHSRNPHATYVQAMKNCGKRGGVTETHSHTILAGSSIIDLQKQQHRRRNQGGWGGGGGGGGACPQISKYAFASPLRFPHKPIILLAGNYFKA